MDNVNERLSRLRKRYKELAVTRKALEEEILYTKEVYRGSLATIRRKRKTQPSVPYYYISCWIDGHRAVVYVSQKDLPRVKKLIDNWQAYKKRMRRLKDINGDIQAIMREIADLRMVKEVKNEGRQEKKEKKRQTRTKT
jgi:hypothetical protein